MARYKVHLPARIALAEKTAGGDKVSYAQASSGHCETISKSGFALSFVGSRFADEEFAVIGRLLFVTVSLPNGPIEALVQTVTHERTDQGKAKWLVGTSIKQISDTDRERLSSYVDKKAVETPALATH